jgi:hypothetical protein
VRFDGAQPCAAGNPAISDQRSRFQRPEALRPHLALGLPLALWRSQPYNYSHDKLSSLPYVGTQRRQPNTSRLCFCVFLAVAIAHRRRARAADAPAAIRSVLARIAGSAVAHASGIAASAFWMGSVINTVTPAELIGPASVAFAVLIVIAMSAMGLFSRGVVLFDKGAR